MNVRTLTFPEILEKSIVNVMRLEDAFKFHFIYYKLITGKGLEFDRIRKYVPGDDPRRIDWNVYVRLREFYVRIFKEERQLDVIFLVDVSSTMVLGTTKLIKNEYSSILTTTLATIANLLGDAIGAIFFSSGVKKFIEPSLSFDNVLLIAKAFTEKGLYGGEKKWEEIEPIVLESFGEDSFFFIITDFIPYREEFFDFLSSLVNKFKGCMMILLRDPIDSYLPKGIGKLYLSDVYGKEIVIVDVDKIRKEYNKLVAIQERKIRNKCIGRGVEFVKVLTNEDFVWKLVKLLSVKKEI